MCNISDVLISVTVQFLNIDKSSDPLLCDIIALQNVSILKEVQSVGVEVVNFKEFSVSE